MSETLQDRLRRWVTRMTSKLARAEVYDREPFLADVWSAAKDLDDLHALVEALEGEVERDKPLHKAICEAELAAVDAGYPEGTYLATVIAALHAKLVQLEGELAECYRLTGADPDGNDDAQLAPHAVAEVRRLRSDSDTAEAALAQAQGERDRLRAVVAQVEWVDDGDGWPFCPWCHVYSEPHSPSCERQAALKG